MRPISNGIVWLDVIPNTIAGAACVAAILFVIVYASFANWRKTSPGRSLMYAVVSLAAVLAMNTLHLALAPYPGVEFVRITVYTALLVSISRLVIALIAILKNDGDASLASFVHTEPRTERAPMLAKIQSVAKFLVALIGTLITAGTTFIPAEYGPWLGFAAAILTAVATYAVPNVPVEEAPRHSAE